LEVRSVVGVAESVGVASGKELAFHGASLGAEGKSLRSGVDLGAGVRPDARVADAVCLKIEVCIAKNCCCLGCDSRRSVVVCFGRPSMGSRNSILFPYEGRCRHGHCS